jgi:DNA end-binding protein Ku
MMNSVNALLPSRFRKRPAARNRDSRARVIRPSSSPRVAFRGTTCHHGQNWKGYLKLSLVTCSVELFPATSDKETVSFHLLNSATGHRLKQQYVDNETGRVVDRDNRVKGYEVAKDDYVIVSDEELAAIEIESIHTIDIEKFVARSEVDPVYLDNPYFIVPDDKVGQEAFGVIREAMRQRGVAGIARVALHGRE